MNDGFEKEPYTFLNPIMSYENSRKIIDLI